MANAPRNGRITSEIANLHGFANGASLSASAMTMLTTNSPAQIRFSCLRLLVY